MQQKKVFQTIIIIFAILLVMLPFLVSFNEALTSLFLKIKAYTWLQNKIVPYEVSMVGLLTAIFGINFVPFSNGMSVNGTFLAMTWNCLGWQSLFFLSITLLVGLGSGNYTVFSKMEAIIIGILGTFFMNLIRLVIIVLIFVFLRPIYFYVYHDYLNAVAIILWLMLFWWFSYKYVLVEKTS